MLLSPRTPDQFKQEEGDTTLPLGVPTLNSFHELRSHVNTLRATGYLPSAAAASSSSNPQGMVEAPQATAVANLDQQFQDEANQS